MHFSNIAVVVLLMPISLLFSSILVVAIAVMLVLHQTSMTMTAMATTRMDENNKDVCNNKMMTVMTLDQDDPCCSTVGPTYRYR
jgi:predicted lipoprotein with Yx(FWY)xxD motif